MITRFQPRSSPSQAAFCRLGDSFAIASINKIVPVTIPLLRRAVEIKALYGLQFYDAQIIAAAETAECSEIWSEDLGDGQHYCGILCMNPFDK